MVKEQGNTNKEDDADIVEHIIAIYFALNALKKRIENEGINCTWVIVNTDGAEIPNAHLGKIY